jgi:hypothetical protein
MQEFIEAIKVGDDLKILDNADSALDEFNETDKSVKWKFLCSKMKQSNVNNTLEDRYKIKNLEELLVTYDVNSEFLEPFDLTTIPSKEKSIFEHRFKEQSPINGFTRAWNSIMIFYYMFQDKLLASPLTQFFCNYLDLFHDEPFHERPDGGIFINPGCIDAAVSLRVKLYIRTVWEEMTGKLDTEVAMELFFFLFKNPQRNTLRMKNMKSKWLACAFTMSTTGHYCKWSSTELDSFTYEEMPLINLDMTTFSRLKTDLAETAEELKEAGCGTILKRFQFLTRAEVNNENVGMFSTYWFLEAVSGYLRSSYAKVALKSMAESKGRNSFKPGNLMAKEYYSLWYDFLSSYVKDIPDREEHFILNAYNTLTTRSNGLNDTLGLDPEDQRPNPDVHKFDIEAPDGSNISWKVTDKALTFRIDPKALFDYYKMVRSLTLEDMGRLFTRYVPARNARLVYGMPIYRFLAEQFTPYLVTFISKIKYNPVGVDATKATPVSTVAIDTGRYMTEMGPYLYSTGNPSNGTMILLSDFDAFDTTQMYDNWRTYAVAAAKQILVDYESELAGKKYEVLGGRNPIEYLIGNWETLNGAVFRVYTSAKTYEPVSTNWEFSGEFSTLVTNTLVNLSFVRAFIAELTVRTFVFEGEKYLLSDFIRVENFKLQGDDQISMIKFLEENKYRTGNPHFVAAIQTAVISLVNEVAGTGGLVISVKKTELRFGYFEFLKKAGMWGYAVPRYMQISLEEAENINRTMDPIERMRARLGPYREYEFRGGSTYFGLIRRYLEWNLVRVVKYERSESITEAELPFAQIWTPIGDGGVGMYPWTVVDPNVDIMLSLYPWHPKVRFHINACIAANKKAPGKDNSSIVSQVSKHMQKGMKLQAELDGAVHSTKLQIAKEIHDELVAGGMKPDPAAYHVRYEQEIREAIEDDKKMANINVHWKRVRSRAIIDAFKDILESTSFPDDALAKWFIPGVKFESREIIHNSKLPVCPVAGLDPFLGQWLQQIGTSSEDRVMKAGGFSAINATLSRAGFPKNLKANNIEAIANSLLRNNFTTETEIQKFLLMRGVEPEYATLVANKLAGKLDMLKYLASVSAFSFVGEGFTDKSEDRIYALTEFAKLDIDNTSNFSQLIRSVAYQYIRVQKLWNYDGKQITYNPRRDCLIHTDEETTIRYITELYSKNVEDVASKDQIEQMLRDIIYV